MNGRIDGWMDGWMDEVSCLGLSWAAGQSCGSRWWSPWVEAQVTWLQGAPPCPALFPLLCQLPGLYQFHLQLHWTDQQYQKGCDLSRESGGDVPPTFLFLFMYFFFMNFFLGLRVVAFVMLSLFPTYQFHLSVIQWLLQESFRQKPIDESLMVVFWALS